jgi:hypothetical protein
MDLLADIVLYGVGAAALILVVLVLIGLVAGVSSFVQAYRYEVRKQHSSLQDKQATRHVSSASPQRVHASWRPGANGTQPSALVERLLYPARTFDRHSLRLIDRGLPFVVIVPATSRKRVVVERELPAMVYLRSPKVSLWRSFVDKLRTSGLWACIAHAVTDDKYAVTYAVDADITINFEPASQVPGED